MARSDTAPANRAELATQMASLTCAQVAEAFQQRKQGPVDPDLQQRVMDHLASCEGCRTALEAMQRDGVLPANAFLAQRRSSWSGWLLADVDP